MWVLITSPFGARILSPEPNDAFVGTRNLSNSRIKYLYFQQVHGFVLHKREGFLVIFRGLVLQQPISTTDEIGSCVMKRDYLRSILPSSSSKNQVTAMQQLWETGWIYRYLKLAASTWILRGGSDDLKASFWAFPGLFSIRCLVAGMVVFWGPFLKDLPIFWRAETLGQLGQLGCDQTMGVCRWGGFLGSPKMQGIVPGVPLKIP